MMGRTVYRDIEIRGVVYADVNAAAAALGVCTHAVRSAVRRGTQHRIGTCAKGVEPMPVSLAGQQFANARAAAAHFGVSCDAIYKAIDSGRAQHFGAPRRRVSPKSKPLAIGSLRFASMDEASRVLGFGRGYISLAMRRRSKAGLQRILAAAMQEAMRDDARRDAA
ncbi:MAG: hypothetical protein H5U19_08190 [Rhodobacteraceae bacterium]|nr:hypothetical protein [Paracoccaceae bacterium]